MTAYRGTIDLVQDDPIRSMRDKRCKTWATETVRRLGLDRARLAVWGLACNENAQWVKNGPSLHTLAKLPEGDVVVHDRQVPDDGLPGGITRVADPRAALHGAAALLILTPWPA